MPHQLIELATETPADDLLGGQSLPEHDLGIDQLIALVVGDDSNP
jgi:hypothetical protein